MAREFFKNLPSQETPFNASRWNGLLNGNEAMGSIVVEDITCKNMFDKNSGDILKNKYLDPDGSIGNSSISSVSGYIEVKPNTYYTLNIVSYSAIYDKVVVFYDSDKNYINGIQESNKVYTYTFKTPSNTKYIRFRFPNIHLDDTQLEIGQVATNYVEHKEYENKDVYSINEIKIGSWLGKTIYRKVVSVGILPNATSKSVKHNISNLDHYVKIWGIAYANSKGAIPLPYVHYVTNNSVIISADIDYVSVSTGADRSVFNGFVILEYTKTTD